MLSEVRKMNIQEIETWLATEEGTKWLEEKKAPLLTKNKELLESIHAANGRVTDALRAQQDAEKLLSDERGLTEKLAVDEALAADLRNQGVFPQAIPGVVAEIKQAYGLTVTSDGQGRKVSGKNSQGLPVDLVTATREYLSTPDGKAVQLNGNSGGGANGSQVRSPASGPTLENKSGRDLAKMSDSDFQAAINAQRGKE
jgi:hypothetical protein